MTPSCPTCPAAHHPELARAILLLIEWTKEVEET